MKFRTYMSSLRTLSDEHYYNKISFSEYREKRTELLMLIDEELNGIKIYNDSDEVESSLLDRALSFLNLDKLKETN